ncbi:hypothetical protein WH50_22820 [Pokkaliibacter plantistimulans]|uniref:4Fe-4S ferredoxin-type domain-containing protein n=1 Tax=Pokkaliibacter plantistimulans TaxID=1635171 RepID=A0ABX5LSC6_9GAMM|nr:4Fe-4S dicluster domain-containing protein [Pokkaliibacter plantistimulans]PXF29069.1 hypothetical protein WH50_22820 [Pokkaliibacter plantistimulans]
MKKWNLIIDVDRCHNCGNCVLTNQDEHVGNTFHGYTAPQPRHDGAWIRIRSRAEGQPPMVATAHLPTLCNHCDNAPCVAAGRGAVVKRQDGIVIFDPQLAKGRKDLVDACPYGAVHWNAELELPQIWIFDAHLLDQGWHQPRCVQACPTGAMQAVQLTDAEMQEQVKQDQLQVLQPELRTQPRVYYRHLTSYTHCFIGGSLFTGEQCHSECVAGARVRLSRDGHTLGETHSDDFGDFRFSGLARNSGRYRLDIEHAATCPVSLDVELREASVYMGALRLTTVSPGAISVSPVTPEESHHV